MACRLIQVHIDNKHLDVLHVIRDEDAVIDSWKTADGKSHACFSLVVHAQDVERITDKLQVLVKKDERQSIIVSALDAVLPRPLTDKTDADRKDQHKNGSRISREELYEDVAANSSLNWVFAALVVLSTVVAAIGLLENDVAVVIGAMVIAPLLGPNLALALSTALGDRALAIQSIKANVFGVSLCLGLAVIIGAVWPGSVESDELLNRTKVSYDNIALAIAAGAAELSAIPQAILPPARRG